jgi:hypothetical protein
MDAFFLLPLYAVENYLSPLIKFPQTPACFIPHKPLQAIFRRGFGGGLCGIKLYSAHKIPPARSILQGGIFLRGLGASGHVYNKLFPFPPALLQGGTGQIIY